MSVLAAGEARETEPDLARIQELQGGAEEPAAAVAATGARPEGARIPWEGESTPLHMVWRCLILAGLAAAQLPLQLTTFGYLLGSTASAGPVYWLAIAVSLVVALGPFLAGIQLRARQATGADRRIGLVVIVLTVAWLAAAVVLGLVGGRAYQARHGLNAGQHPSTVTLVVMFSALLLVIGATAFMLGLAGHHPTQQVHVRERQIGERAEIMASRAAVRLNPDYQPPGPDGLEVSLEAAEREITATYESAIEGYYAALCEAMADPAFTEAVQARRVEAVATGD
jgi:hypothetical protein